MDNFFTILLYVGALILIGLIKSISKAGKKKPIATNHISAAIKEEKQADGFDIDFPFDFLQENPTLQKAEAKQKKITAPLPVVSIQNEENKPIKKTSDTLVSPTEREELFIFGDFNLPTAIVYSEILKKRDY